MKKMLIALLAICSWSAWAENLTAKDGTLYRNVTIVSANPERMLIVHDGGGCQVEFKDLAVALTVEQRQTVEEQLRYYVERTERLEKARAERVAFETAQRSQGKVEFEGGWVTPLEREEILLNREERKLELERKRMQLAKDKAALEKEQLQTEQARYLLEGETRGSTSSFSYGYYRPYRKNCIPSLPCRHNYHCARHSGYRSAGTSIIYGGQSNPYITFENAASYNRGPFNR
ncbi:hypothetical protein P4B35_09655 [Pontiellaceae bacterium B12227]|nr:hypothetical protein [Pontiellaceae bacterium B12227]